jgi:hypothetical protein
MLAGLSNRLQAAPFLGLPIPVSLVSMGDTSFSNRCCSLSSRELLRIFFAEGTETPLPSDVVRFIILLPCSYIGFTSFIVCMGKALSVQAAISFQFRRILK